LRALESIRVISSNKVRLLLLVMLSTSIEGALKMKSRAICLALLLISFVITVKAQEKKLKIYISADMEGVVGVVTGEQLGPQGFEYARFREFMTQEVNAAIEGAVEAGATEIVVSDSHGNGQNLLIEKLPKDILLVRSWPRPLMMMQGIDFYWLSHRND
jgi:D-amino peptidase